MAGVIVCMCHIENVPMSTVFLQKSAEIVERSKKKEK